MTTLNFGSIAGNGRFWLAEVNARRICGLGNLLHHPGDLSATWFLLDRY